jgi:hypothetical protein
MYKDLVGNWIVIQPDAALGGPIRRETATRNCRYSISIRIQSAERSRASV